MSKETRNPYEYCKKHKTISVKTTAGCPFCLQAELAKANEQLREIGDLCNNCRNLSDAQEIAYGKEDTSTESGCDKCWVEQLQAGLETANEKNKRLREATGLLNSMVLSGEIHTDTSRQVVEQALKGE